MVNAMGSSKLDLLTAKNSVLILVDYQPGMFKGVSSGDRTSIKNAAVAAAKALPIGQVTGKNPSTNEVSISNLYDRIDMFNINEIFQTPLDEETYGSNVYGGKAVAYFDDYGNVDVAFLTETVNTYHRHALAFLVGGEKGDFIYNGLYDRAADVFARSTAYEIQYDKTTGQIIGIKRDAQTVKQQISTSARIQKSMLDALDNAFLESIDERILTNLLSSEEEIITEPSGFSELVIAPL